MDTKLKKKVAEQKETKDTRISQLYNYEQGISYYDAHIVSRQAAWAEKYMEGELPTVIDPKCRIGIEVEVENAPRYTENNLFCWKVHADDSLRNNGREFVSFPILGQTIPLGLRVLYDHVLGKGYDFSKRTSVHVHMNVRDMTPTQVTALVCLFVVFEKILYKFVGHDRDKNIFCVPLQQTLIMNNLLPSMQRGFKNNLWYKYSGLNLLPIATQGSIEFRQLYGTDNVLLICQWINLLMRMRQYALMESLDSILDEIKSLNTNSNYDFFIGKVFQEQVRDLDTSSLVEDMEAGVICVKQSTLTNHFHQGIMMGISRESELGQILLKDVKPVSVTQAIGTDATMENIARILNVPVGELRETQDRGLRQRRTGGVTQWYGLNGEVAAAPIVPPPPVDLWTMDDLEIREEPEPEPEPAPRPVQAQTIRPESTLEERTIAHQRAALNRIRQGSF